MTQTAHSFLDIACASAKEAGALALSLQSRLQDIRYKGAKDLVTEADLACDRIIRERLSAAFPSHNLVTEEAADKAQGSEYTWYVDPIDGTINYSRGFPLWGVSIGLRQGDTTLCGAIYLPAFDHLYTCIRGGGAFCNGKPIHVTAQSDLSQAIISHGDFNVGSDENERRRLNEANFLARMRTVSLVQRVKCMGSAIVEGAYVASGRMEGYCMVVLNPWDVAVTTLLVTEAGGRVTTLRGEPWKYGDNNALFSNGLLHDDLLASLEWDKTGTH